MQKLQQQSIETVYQSPTTKANVVAGKTTPPTCTTSETDSDGERRRRLDCPAEHCDRRSHSTHSTSSQSDKHDKLNSKSRNTPVSEESRVRSLEAEASSKYKRRGSSNAACKSKKRKGLRSAHDRVSTVLDYNIHRWLRDQLCRMINSPNTLSSERQGYTFK